MKGTLKVVPAGAGAGKTYHIQDQLTKWVRDKTVDPARILAVTFTEAAAAELLGRIRDSLLKADLIEAAFDLERANVSTIHALGLRLITEHAFATGFTPAPRQLQSAEEDLLIRKAIAHSEALRPLAAEPERFGHAAGWDKGSEEGFRDRVLEMIALLRGLGAAGCDASLAKVACERIDRLWGHVMADPGPARDRLAQAAQAMITAFPKGAVAEGQKPAQAKDFRADLARLRAACEPGRLDKDWAIWQGLRKLRKSGRGCTTPAGYDALAEEVELASSAITTHPGPREDAKTNLRCLILGAQEIMANYAERKRRSGAMDFTDMIIQTEAMLRERPDVLKAVLGEVDCVIIDEFQDTNPVQFALLWRLAQHAPRTLLVGDVKQSIMGFQGADPRLCRAVEEQNPQSASPLPNNWRSDPRIMAFVNALGPGLFGPSYHPLEPTRKETGQPAIEVLRLSEGRATRKGQKPSAHVAARVADILASGERVVDRATGKLRQVQPSDIAILCRRHAEAARYAEALRLSGLPVRIAATGWLDAQAIQVARYALALATDPSDNHAALMVLSFGPACLDPQTALTHLADASLLNTEELEPFLALASEAALMPVLDLTLRVTALLRPWAQRLPDAVQALADLARLEALAAEFDGSQPEVLAAAGLHGRGAKVFLAWLEARRDERDFDRHPDPGSEAAPGIEVVTWHASKGREWPITIVCELDGKIEERPNTTRAVFNDFSDLSRVLDRAELIHTPKCVVPEIQDIFIGDRQSAAEDDARNLIYVAITRARDRLVVEWIDNSLDSGSCTYLGLLARDASLSCGENGLTVSGTVFPATIVPNPAGQGRDPSTSEPKPYRHFGDLAAVTLAVSDLPFRRRPSSELSASALPAALQTEKIGQAQASGADMSATDRGTAWHRAFRTLADRPDLADRLPAATGLGADVLAAIPLQVRAIREWSTARGSGTLLPELPLSVTHADETETLGIVDLVAMGDAGVWIIDHKTGRTSDPEARFLTYWPQLFTYAEALSTAFQGKPVLGVAIHWMEEGLMTSLPLRQLEHAK